MAIDCIYDPIRNQFGYGDNFYNRLKDYWKAKPTKTEFTNTIRNIGTDDVRMLNVADETGTRLFGKNLTDVSDLDFSKKPVPSNVIVRVPTPDGEKFFVSSSNNVRSYPTRWVRDEMNGKIKAHPEWDQVGVNVTGLAKYVRDNDGAWRLAKEGEEGSFLNIQNPAKGEVDNETIFEKGYDAIQLEDGRYQLIDEASQTIRPSKVTTKPNRGALYSETIEAKPTEKEVAEKLIKDHNIPTRIAYSIAGGLVGNFADENDEYAGTFWGGVLGFALSGPRARAGFKGVYQKVSGAGGKDEYDRIASGSTIKEKQKNLLSRAVDEGYTGDLTDMDAVNKYIAFSNDAKAKLLRGESLRSRLFDNEYFRSGAGLLGKMGQKGKDLLGVFREFQGAPQELYARFGVIQRELFQQRNPKEIFKKTQLDFIRRFPTYQKLTDQDALQSFGAAVDRIISSGARMEDGKFVWDNNTVSNIRYQDRFVRDIDARLLNDPEASKVLRSVKQFYSEVSEQNIRNLDIQINSELDKIGNIPIREVVRNITDSGLTYKQYVEGFSDNPKKLLELKRIKDGKWGSKDFYETHRDIVDTIFNMTEDRLRFQGLKDRYIPQKFSRVKELAEKNKWKQEHASKLEGKNIDELWKREKATRYIAQNNDKFKKFSVTDSGLDVETQYFPSFKAAKVEIEKTISEITDVTKRDIVDQHIKSNPDAQGFIKSKVVNGKTLYYLDTPAWLKNKELFPNGLYAKNNVDKINITDREFMVLNTVKEADFFDRPRNITIPSEFKELDLEELTTFYTEDMGIRMKAIQNGMYNDHAVRDNWLKPIREEVKDQFSTPEALNKKINEVTSWFSTMQNHRKMSAVAVKKNQIENIRIEQETRAKNDYFLNTLAKIATAPFNYATTLYAPFTPMVLGPFFTSWKSVYGVYKDAVLSPKKFANELKNWTQEIEQMNILQKKFESLAPEYKKLYKKQILGDPSSYQRKIADVGDWSTEFTANLSIARAVGIDPENLGLGRLFLGNMLDVSGAEAGMVIMATFRHLDDLTKAYKQFDEGAQTIKFNGNTHTRATMQRQFNDLGVTEVDSFVRKNSQFNDFASMMKGEGLGENIDPEFYSQMVRIMNSTVDQYHGRSKLSRPLKWLDNVWGKALSRYSVYAQNFGVQTTARRIYEPLRNWSDKYKMKDESVPLFKVAYWASTGNNKKFKEVFGDQWEGAYNDFPVDAVNNFFKVFGALGVAKAMMITRGGVLDLTSIATNEALGNDDYEMWRNVNKQRKLGNYADTGEAFYLGDVFSGDVQGFDLAKAFGGMLGLASGAGVFSRYGQFLIDDPKFSRGGLMELTPVTSLPNDIFQRFGALNRAVREDFSSLPETAAKELVDFSLLRLTPGGTFYDMRSGINNGVFKKPKNSKVKFVDEVTGIPVNINYYDL